MKSKHNDVREPPGTKQALEEWQLSRTAKAAQMRMASCPEQEGNQERWSTTVSKAPRDRCSLRCSDATHSPHADTHPTTGPAVGMRRTTGKRRDGPKRAQRPQKGRPRAASRMQAAM